MGWGRHSANATEAQTTWHNMVSVVNSPIVNNRTGGELHPGDLHDGTYLEGLLEQVGKKVGPRA